VPEHLGIVLRIMILVDAGVPGRVGKPVDARTGLNLTFLLLCGTRITTTHFEVMKVF
jgi:hypothetical protein